MSRSLSVFAFLLLYAAALDMRSAGAQQFQPRFPPAAAAEQARVIAPGRAPDVSAPPARHAWLNTVLYAAGGAVVGAWAGYMTSQIVWSDWQEVSRPGVDRMRYTLAGAGIGAIAGALMGHHVSVGAPLPPPAGRRRSPWGDLAVISPEEVRASRAQTAAELVVELRPNWINRRGTDTFGGAAVQTWTSEGVAVYVDGVPIGTIADLTNLSSRQVDSVEYYDVQAATLRWGAAAGVRAIINVLTTNSPS